MLLFRVATKPLKSSRTCQLSLLHKEIRQKKSNIRVLRKKFDFLLSVLQTKTSFIDFAHVRSLFLRHNDNVLKPKSTVQQKKFNNLLEDKKPHHDPEKNIFNHSSYFLSEAEQSLLLKALNFSIPPKNLIILIKANFRKLL